MSLPADEAALRLELKQLVVEICDLEGVDPTDIQDDERLIRGRAELDLTSLDAVEIAAEVEYRYGVRIEDLRASEAAFRSIATLAAYIREHHA